MPSRESSVKYNNGCASRVRFSLFHKFCATFLHSVLILHLSYLGHIFQMTGRKTYESKKKKNTIYISRFQGD